MTHIFDNGDTMRVGDRFHTDNYTLEVKDFNKSILGYEKGPSVTFIVRGLGDEFDSVMDIVQANRYYTNGELIRVTFKPSKILPKHSILSANIA
jgi:hypothetical protein